MAAGRRRWWSDSMIGRAPRHEKGAASQPDTKKTLPGSPFPKIREVNI